VLVSVVWRLAPSSGHVGSKAIIRSDAQRQFIGPQNPAGMNG